MAVAITCARPKSPAFHFHPPPAASLFHLPSSTLALFRPRFYSSRSLLPSASIVYILARQPQSLF